MLQNTGDSYLFVYILRKIPVRFDWIGVALGFQRITGTTLYDAAGNTLCRRAAGSLSLRSLSLGILRLLLAEANCGEQENRE